MSLYLTDRNRVNQPSQHETRRRLNENAAFALMRNWLRLHDHSSHVYIANDYNHNVKTTIQVGHLNETGNFNYQHACDWSNNVLTEI